MIVCVEGEGYFEQAEIAKELESKHRIYCRKVGLSRRSRQTAEFKEPPYMIDRLALAYVYEQKLFKIDGTSQTTMNDVLATDLYRVFCQLRPSYFLLDGSKFGATFLAYKGHPDECHAELLVFTDGGLVEASRLAAIAKKACIYIHPPTL